MYLKNTNNRNIKQKLTTLVISNLAILTLSSNIYNKQLTPILQL